MQLANNLEITFTMDNAKINKDIFSALCYNMAQVGTSAKEAGEALRKLSICLYDKQNEINYIHSVAPDEISQELAGPATPAATETPNQNVNFDFLEQNAYDEVKNIFDGEQFGQIIPLDMPKNL